MSIWLGKKFSDKDLAKATECLQPELADGEELVCAVRAIGTRPAVDTLVMTNQRIITLYRNRGSAVEASYPIATIRRLAFDGSDVWLRTFSDEDYLVCRLSHGVEDSVLLRRAFTAVGEETDPGSNVVRDPTANAQGSPRTKERALQQGLAKIDAYLTDGEILLYALEDIGDWYFITNKRLITLMGTWKVNAQELDLTQYVRIAVELDGNKWIVAAVDSHQNYALIGKLNREDEARWLARSIEMAYPQMSDPWRDYLQQFIDSLGLSYAFEAILPLLWPGIAGERLIWSFGSGEDHLIFTSRRLVVLPDLVAIPLESVRQAVFAAGREEHYYYDGNLEGVVYGLACEMHLVDGRQVTRLFPIGATEREFDGVIAQVNAALGELSSAGYPIVAGERWVQQTQSPPPSQRYATSYSMEFDVEF